MKTLQKILLGWMAPIILTGSALVTDADAGVRVSATLRTPAVVVRVGHPPYALRYKDKTRRLPVRQYRVYTVTSNDWMVAGRLASVTRVAAQELIQLRRYGYTWFEIGHYLYLPPRVTRAALDHRTWKRFLREQQMARHHGRPFRDQAVIHLDEGLCFEVDH